jgi:hypothetical protein
MISKGIDSGKILLHDDLINPSSVFNIHKGIIN